MAISRTVAEWQRGLGEWWPNSGEWWPSSGGGWWPNNSGEWRPNSGQIMAGQTTMAHDRTKGPTVGRQTEPTAGGW